MRRPAQVTTALWFTVVLALVSISTRGLLLPTLDVDEGFDGILAVVLAVELLVLGVALLVVAGLAFRPSSAIHKLLRGLYVVALVDASLWLAAGIALWIALLVDTGSSMRGHGTADALATALLVAISAPRMAWSVLKIVIVAFLYRAMTKHASRWLAASTA